MGRDISLLLMRAAGILLAGMLLFAVFGHAHAQTQTPQSQTLQNQAGDNYGLKRFDGDNYDTLPPGAGIPPPPSPQGYAQVPGAGGSSNGYYSTLNGSASQAPAQGYQP